jgi:prepilin-type N-terminal cleavage/methylation domain-containing protein
MKPLPSIAARRRHGLSLLELLTVIAVIGVLSAIGFVNFTKYREILNVRMALTQVTKNLEQARTYSRRYNQTYRFQIATDNVSFAIEPWDSVNSIVLTGTTAPPSIRGKLPENALFDPSRSDSDMFYTAPFGQRVSSALCFPIALAQSTSKPRGAFAVIGVMGKIYTRAITYNTTSPCS